MADSGGGAPNTVNAGGAAPAEAAAPSEANAPPPAAADASTMRQRVVNFTTHSLASALAPIVDRVNAVWLQNNNTNSNNLNNASEVRQVATVANGAGGAPPPANLSVTIINENESRLALSVDLQEQQQQQRQERRVQIQEAPGSPSPPDSDEEAGDYQRNDPDGLNANRTVDLNVSEYVPALLKCCAFLLVLTIKFVYDHLEGVLTFVVMQLVFLFVCDEQFASAGGGGGGGGGGGAARTKGSLRALVRYLAVAKGLHYVLAYEGLQSTLALYAPGMRAPASVWDVAWTAYMNDCALQFAATGAKLLFKALPLRVMAFKTKLKVYSFLEAGFQLYRAAAPTQVWILYFLNSYQGNDYVLSIFLAGAYMVLKSCDCTRKCIAFGRATRKLFKRSGLATLSKEQLASKGIKCSICLDDFEFPIQLSCQHVFCSTCIQQWSVKNRTCPLCRTPMNEDFASATISSTVFLQIF